MTVSRVKNGLSQSAQPALNTGTLSDPTCTVIFCILFWRACYASVLSCMRSLHGYKMFKLKQQMGNKISRLYTAAGARKRNKSFEIGDEHSAEMRSIALH